MDDKIVSQLFDCYKTIYGVKLDSPESLLQAQQNLLEFVMGLGRKLEHGLFAEGGTGYQGAIVEREGRRFKFLGHRATEIHGLFGMIRYRRRTILDFHGQP